MHEVSRRAALVHKCARPPQRGNAGRRGMFFLPPGFLAASTSAAVVRLTRRAGSAAPLHHPLAARPFSHLPLARSTVSGGGHGSYFAATCRRRLQFSPSTLTRLFRRLASGDTVTGSHATSFSCASKCRIRVLRHWQNLRITNERAIPACSCVRLMQTTGVNP
jgi:hypothetical protein